MSWQEYKPSDKIQARRDAFDKDTRNTNIMIGIVLSAIACITLYGLYDDYVKGNAIVTLSSQLEECKLNSQSK